MRGEGTGSELTCGATCRWSNVSRPTIRCARCRHGRYDLERTVAPVRSAVLQVGRPSIPPEHLLRALLLQCSTACAASGSSWSSSTTTCCSLVRGLGDGRPDLGRHGVHEESGTTAARRHRARLFRAGPRPGRAARAAVDEHFTVDGTLIDAGEPQELPAQGHAADDPDDPGNPTVNFHGERRRNATHSSTTDPQALLYRKGARREAKLCYQATC